MNTENMPKIVSVEIDGDFEIREWLETGGVTVRLIGTFLVVTLQKIKTKKNSYKLFFDGTRCSNKTYPKTRAITHAKELLLATKIKEKSKC